MGEEFKCFRLDGDDEGEADGNGNVRPHRLDLACWLLDSRFGGRPSFPLQRKGGASDGA